uniref:Integrase, catalytic region, zinc finger, CCHC-type, peptidase aspartic, catalytic n=1 Tax=Tanacetum cinerariifolium TaxID=118510 RepID=A0A6L2KV35_TANCI|nr:integrase, catalytic region, zinc finger, CCHC-type, peptidase aspartic, catalytic [Tanacetum cinerariifolium]
MHMAVSISTREPKRTVNQSAATPLKRKIVVKSTNQKPRSTIRKQYEQIRRHVNCGTLVEIILFIVDSGCSKHMMRNLKLLINFVENLPGNATIKRVYYVEGLNHNLFSIGQFYDTDLEVAFQKSTCYIRDLKGNDLLTSSCGLDLYSITLQDTSTPNPICLMAKSSSSQNYSLVIPRHEKTPYHIINGQKPSIKFFYIFGSLCYIIRDGVNLDKMKEKGHVSSDPAPQCLITTLEHDSLSLGLQSQEKVPQAAKTVTTSNEMDFLFRLMFDELHNGTTQVVLKSSAATTADAPNQQKIASNLKFLNNLQPEWSRHVTIVHQTKDLHTADYTQLYDFLKYNQKEVDELKAERLAKIQDPLALMANSNNPYASLAPHQDLSPFNQTYMEQPMPNPEDITDPTTNQIGNGNLVAVRAEGNAAGHNGNQIRCYNCRGVGHFARDCTVRPRRRDAAYLQTQLLIAQKEEAGI